jgi:hypothetical protein
MAIIPNIGTYPATVTFCKMIDISNMTPDNIIANEFIDDLLTIEAQFAGNDVWSLVYQNASFITGTGLLNRKFTTKSWSKDKFQICNSLDLGHETLLLQQLRFNCKWLDCRNLGKFKSPNLQVFLHGWGSFEKVTNEIPLAEVPQVFQLHQETVLTLSSKGKECTFYESGSFDECLERSALRYANDIVGCIEEPQR